jgi:myosin heavy subunit
MSIESQIENFIYLDDCSIDKICDRLQYRFMNRKIYTYFGNILFSINPYQYFTGDDDIYSIERYNQSNKTRAHLFNTIETIIKRIGEYRGQTIIISGESGSVKTETVKNIIHYLNHYTTNESINLLERIEKCGLLLEQLGNAKTTRNHNSSRFGKYIQIYYNDNRECLGMNTNVYLLEKTRLHLQNYPKSGESNFHIFETLTTRPEYINELLTNIGFSNEKKLIIINIIKSIPIILDIKLDDRLDHSINQIADLLNINSELLKNTLTARTSNIGGENIKKVYTNDEFLEICDTFAMKLYEKTFLWIVDEMNQYFLVQNIEKSNVVGLLDIFGFENFENNSLEQFCINYTNEILQQYLNKKTIQDKIEFYESECLPLTTMDCDVSQNSVKVIELLQSIFFKLDEECFIPKGNDKTFIEKLNQEFQDNVNYHSKRLKKYSEFSIEHFAGKLDYQVDGFLKKNTDRANSDIENLVLKVFEAEEAKKRKKTKNKLKMNSITNQFRNQLDEFMKTIESHEIYFIKCIKPNEKELALSFNIELVKKQLEYNGVLKLIQIFKQGYPYHFTKDKFEREYHAVFTKIDHLFTIGKNRYFFTDENYELVKHIKYEMETQAQITISKNFRCWIATQNFSKKKAAINRLSNYIFSKLCYRDLKTNLGVVRIQRSYKLHINRIRIKRIVARNKIVRCIKSYIAAKKMEEEMAVSSEITKYIIAKKNRKTLIDKKQAYLTISKWWRGYLNRKNNLIEKNEYLESQVHVKDKRICELEMRVQELELRLSRSLHIDKSILNDRDHMIIQLKKDIECFSNSIQERIREKMSLIDEIESLKVENKILIRQMAYVRNKNNWFTKWFGFES